jgi:hypothetical protein
MIAAYGCCISISGEYNYLIFWISQFYASGK